VNKTETGKVRQILKDWELVPDKWLCDSCKVLVDGEIVPKECLNCHKEFLLVQMPRFASPKYSNNIFVLKVRDRLPRGGYF